MEIIVKKYAHYNRALNKFISSKRDYNNEMARQGMVPFEEGKAIAEKAKAESMKKYELCQKSKDIISTVHAIKDSKGNVKLSDRTIDAMKEVVVSFNDSKCPSHYKKSGGFE